MEESRADQGLGRRLGSIVALCAFMQIAVSIAVAFADPDAPSSLIDNYGMVLIVVLLPSALTSVLIRRLVERSRGEATFVGPWAGVMRAKIVFQLALLGALPVLGLAVALTWLMAGAVGGLGRAWLLLLVGGAVIGMAGSCIANSLNVLSPRDRNG